MTGHMQCLIAMSTETSMMGRRNCITSVSSKFSVHPLIKMEKTEGRNQILFMKDVKFIVALQDTPLPVHRFTSTQPALPLFGRQICPPGLCHPVFSFLYSQCTTEPELNTVLLSYLPPTYNLAAHKSPLSELRKTSAKENKRQPAFFSHKDKMRGSHMKLHCTFV